MEKFLPVLDKIQTHLKDILLRNKKCMISWDMSSLKTVGEDITSLAKESYPQLIQVEHRVLYQALREAGLGIKNRAARISKKGINSGDRQYFRNVYNALTEICEKIETGEYYKALQEVVAQREQETLSLHR